MVACNIIGWANIVLVLHLVLLLLVQGSSSQKTVAQKNVSLGGNSTRSLPNVTSAPRPSNSSHVRGRKMITMLPRKKVVTIAVAYRFNILLVGGSFNMIISLLNLIVALLNFYFLVGKYDTTLHQTVGKLKVAIEEMSTRDLHPKIKMSFQRRMMPDSPFFPQILQRLKEPSPMFDGSNHLLEGQKELRLRKTRDLELKRERELEAAKSKATSPAPKTPAKSPAKSPAQSPDGKPASPAKKNK